VLSVSATHMQYKLVASSHNAVHCGASKTNTPHEARNERQANRLSLSTATASEDHTRTLSTATSSMSTARWLTEPRMAPSAYGFRPFAAQEGHLVRKSSHWD